MTASAPSRSELDVVIVGAGVGGLIAAIALTRKGVRVQVLERTATVTALGASLALDFNAMRVLTALGLLDRLRRVGVPVHAVEHLRWDTGDILFRTPLGPEAEAHFGAPALDFLRSDLQHSLVDALPAGTVMFGAEVASVEQDARRAAVVLADGRRVGADAVIAADGINSRIRGQLIGAEDAPVFSGTVVYRGLAPREDVVEIEPDAVHRYWVGPDRHCVVYWISAGRLMAVNAAVRNTEEAHRSPMNEADPQEVFTYLDGWDPRLLTRVRSCRVIRRNSVFVRRPLERWAFGRIALLGDAAHAMEPFEAQGAAQAIEDSYALAECLEGARPDEVEAALARYQHVRITRANHVQRSSSAAAEMFYLPEGPEQRRRDADFATLHERQRWGRRQQIWEYDVRLALQ